MKKLLVIAAIFITASCSHYDQKINLELSTTSEKSSVGNDIGINLKILDERSNPEILGKKEFCNDDEISLISNKNLAQLIDEEISAGLAKKGFISGNDVAIEVLIKKLNYKAECEFLTGKSKAHALIRVSTTSKRTGVKLAKNFELSIKNKHFLGPLSKTDKKIINELLSEIIQDILSDDILLNK